MLHNQIVGSQPMALPQTPPNDLILVETVNEQLTVDSRIIARELGNEHSSLMSLIDTHLESIESYFGKVGFEIVPSGKTNQPTRIANLTEDQALFIGSLSRNTSQVVSFKAKLVRSFSAARKALSQVFDPQESTNLPALPQTYAEALRQLAEKVEVEERLTRENEELKPKAHATEILLTSNETISIGNYAKVIGWGQNRLFEQMRKDKYLIPSGEGYNLPYQTYIDRAYFEVVETTYVRTAGTIIHKQPRITPKGQVYFATKYGQAGKGGQGHA